MGVALRSTDGSVPLALRHDPARAATLAGFDPIALGVPTRSDLEEWLRRFDELGQPHGGILTGHAGWVIAGLHDPAGIEVRLYTLEKPALPIPNLTAELSEVDRTAPLSSSGG